MTITISSGLENRVNTVLANDQNNPAMAPLPGGYVIVWQSAGEDGNGLGVFGQRYDLSGAKVGGEFLVNTTTANDQAYASVAVLKDGGFVVSWTSTFQDGGGLYGVYSQRFDASGAKVGGEVQDNSFIYGDQEDSTVTGLADGGYLIVWTSSAHDNSGHYQIWAQRYDVAGATVGSEFMVSTDTAHDKGAPHAASLSDGGFVVVWMSENQDSYGGGGIYQQRYDSSGQAVGGETVVNTIFAGEQDQPRVAALAGGGYVVTWYGVGANSVGEDVFFQRYDANGAKVGGATTVNTTTTGDQLESNIAALQDGGWVVTWNSDIPAHVYSQRYAADGSKVGGETLVENVLDPQAYTSVAAGLSNGGIAYAWAGPTTAGGDADVFQKLAGTTQVSPNLGTGVEVATGDGADDTFLAAPGTINSGDVIDGGGGVNTLRLTAAQSADFTGVTLAHIQTILGSSGDDTIRFPTAPPAGTAFNSGGGHDTLVLGGPVDLSTLSLTGSWTVQAAPGQDVLFTLTSASQIGLISGAGANLTVDASTVALTAAQRASLFAAGVHTVLQPGGMGYGAQTVVTSTAEAPVDLYKVQSQTLPAAAALANGGAVVAWQAATGTGTDIYVQRFDHAGAAIGSATIVDTPITNAQYEVTVAGLSGGGFVVGWRCDNFQGPHDGVFFQIYDNTGAKVGSQPLVAPGGSWPSLTGVAGGGFVLAWTGTDNSSLGVHAQLYDATGAAVGAPVLVNTYQQDDQSLPSVSALANGGYVIAWIDSRTYDADGAYAQMFNASGAKVGGEIRVSPSGQSPATGDGPSVTGLADGGFVVTWCAVTSNLGNGWDIFAQRYDASGTAVGGVVTVNTTIASDQSGPSVSALANGGYVVTWTSTIVHPGSANDANIYAQRFDAHGGRDGVETLVNAASTYDQTASSVTGLVNGGYLVAYQSFLQSTGMAVETRTYQQQGYATLTSGADHATGGASDFLIQTAPGDLNAGDVLQGGSGWNTLGMLSSGVLDLTAPSTFSGIQNIVGASGADTFVVSNARLADVRSIDGGAGADLITTAGASLDLRRVSLTSIEAVGTSNAAGTAFYLPTGAQPLQVRGGAGNDFAVYAGNAHAYTIGVTGAAGTVAGGPEGGTDTLTSVENLVFADGVLTFDQNNAAAVVMRMYDTTFGRAPDVLGGQYWTHLYESGQVSLSDMAADFAGSAEFQHDVAGMSQRQVVDFMYQNTLHRPADQAGENAWTAYLQQGHSLGDLVLQFSESAEHKALTAPQVAAGLWDGDASAQTVEFMYEAAFGRAPDAGGLTTWVGALRGGLSLHDMAQAFVSSTEFANATQGMSHRQLVDYMYETALHRAADPTGETSWTIYLDNGGSAADLLVQFEQSQELQLANASHIDHGVWVV